jgi:hypothetical protein
MFQRYEAKPNTSMTVGRSDQCELSLDDDRCAAVNARVIPSLNNTVSLLAEARMYRLIGMSNKPRGFVILLFFL